MVYAGESIGGEPSTVTVSGPAEENYDFIDTHQDFTYGWYGPTHNLNFKRDIGKGETLNLDADFIKRGNYSET